jgi:hypothetical protein
VSKLTEWTDLLERLDDDPLAALQTTAHLQQLLDEELLRQIRRARHAGLSWSRIGGTLGVTRQAVYKRFASLV